MHSARSNSRYRWLPGLIFVAALLALTFPPRALAQATATPTAAPTTVALSAGTTTIVSGASATHTYQMQVSGNTGDLIIESGPSGTNCSSPTVLGEIGPGDGVFYVTPPDAVSDLCAAVSAGTPAMTIQ